MSQIFFSYAHDDEQHRDQLEKHLASLQHEGLIESWHDRRILAGSGFDAEIDTHLEQADVILLLVSSSFLASRYCYGIEMQRAMARHASGDAVVIPVIVRPCDWQKTPLGKLLAVPRHGKPITTWSNFDEAYADVARKVREVIEHLGSSRGGQHSIADTPPREFASRPVASSSPRRSSNMRLRQVFSEADKDNYLHDSFELIAQFFEASLQELQRRHSDVECRYRRVDANNFTAAIYRSGKKEAECGIRLGGTFREDGISYSREASARSNSFNEILTVEHDDQTLFLKAMGIFSQAKRDDKLSTEQAAEYYWQMLIEPMQ
ncbi:MAG TPA: toll/interleukin-1 receptor domain-containing protein [Burkholderiales bacterium]|nr:toll/interleukin-1 receptor domain-containing protein [Burkholderiales bacterium]